MQPDMTPVQRMVALKLPRRALCVAAFDEIGLAMIIRQSLSSLLVCMGLSGALSAQHTAPAQPAEFDSKSVPVIRPRPRVLRDSERIANEITGVRIELHKLLRDESAHKDDRHAAIRRLSYFRSRDDVPLLLQNLVLQDYEILQPGPLAPYPVAQALAQYGDTVYGPIWARANSEWSEEYTYVLAWTLYSMDRTEVPIVRIDHYLSGSEVTPQRKKNFSALREILENVNFDDHRNWPRSRFKKRAQ